MNPDWRSAYLPALREAQALYRQKLAEREAARARVREEEETIRQLSRAIAVLSEAIEAAK